MKNDIYKLLTGKVRITSDSLMGIDEAQRFSNHVKHSVDHAFRFQKDKPDWESYGGSSVWAMINDTDDSMFKRVALHVFSTNFPEAIEKLKSLTIYVEGRCPECGEPTFETSDGETEYNVHEGFIISEPDTYNKCTLCNWIDL
jgi:hypothetical protein